ncbi:unnamed protein product [Porites evermanni]|uniref:Gamma-glutamylcyclotransferase AIG2-like domain-containing protein n=1 Tax=Porites evermanni TaxID=104178 RepID=A0ABN8QQD4_9CNID|nr:unnamed protein product [Porites evermanni]
MEETELYFAFGSNLSARKMRERGTRFISRESAVLRGFRVVFSIWKDDGFGYANIIPDKESTVYGALYICLKGSLAKLDEHEAGRLRKVMVQVERKSGEIVDAIAYQAYEDNNFGSLARTLDLRNKNSKNTTNPTSFHEQSSRKIVFREFREMRTLMSYLMYEYFM